MMSDEDFRRVCEQELTWLQVDYGFSAVRNDTGGYVLRKGRWSVAFALEPTGELGFSFGRHVGEDYNIDWLLEANPEAEGFAARTVRTEGQLREALQSMSRLLTRYCSDALKGERRAIAKIAAIRERHVRRAMRIQKAREAMVRRDYRQCVAILEQTAPLTAGEERMMATARRMLEPPHNDTSGA